MAWRISCIAFFVIKLLIESPRWTLTTWWRWSVMICWIWCLLTVYSFNFKTVLIVAILGLDEMHALLELAAFRGHMADAVAILVVSAAVYDGGDFLVFLTKRCQSDLIHFLCRWLWWQRAVLAWCGRETVVSYYPNAPFFFSYRPLLVFLTIPSFLPFYFATHFCWRSCKSNRECGWWTRSLTAASPLSAHQQRIVRRMLRSIRLIS